LILIIHLNMNHLIIRTDIEDSNIISQKMDSLKSSYNIDYNEEKSDLPKRTSPIEKKFITDTHQKERTGMSNFIPYMYTNFLCIFISYK
jgi:hypothetical protein